MQKSLCTAKQHTLNNFGAPNIQNAPRAGSLDEDTSDVPEGHETRYLLAEALETADRNRIIAQAVDSLPERQRLALNLYYYEEMSYKEIAQVLGLTVSGVAAAGMACLFGAGVVTSVPPLCSQPLTGT